ncbi:cuticle protein 18.6-like [Leptidea sinapis]|uniref:cuticle protein 18.6-like n=1 Tax=Leptidea sinapis TaxID=189913 RepID=UPI0021C435A2|nr:cuticle protein 18.6-like [Leptidea sinapis]
MVHKVIIFSALIVAVTSMFIHPAPIPIFLEQYRDPSYSFSYEVNDARTGDIKSQQESRRGDIVLGQYSLVQPDGVRRTVDYQANDLTGFIATVNNKKLQNTQQQEQEESTRPTTVPSSTSNDGWQSSPSSTSSPSSPSSISFSSFVFLFALVAVASADFSSFSYGVADPYTGDFKSQHESRAGDNVLGQYSLLESDGTRRTVDYSAGAEGFNALVRKDPTVLAAPIAARIATPIGLAPYPYYAHGSPLIYNRLSTQLI